MDSCFTDRFGNISPDLVDPVQACRTCVSPDPADPVRVSSVLMTGHFTGAALPCIPPRGHTHTFTQPKRTEQLRPNRATLGPTVLFISV